MPNLNPSLLTASPSRVAPKTVPTPAPVHYSPLVNDVFRSRGSYVPQRTEQKLPPQLVLDDNTNVYGCSLRAKHAAQKHVMDFAKYPDLNAEHETVAVLAKQLGVNHEQVFIGNGSSELIGSLINVCVRPGEKILYAQQSFAAYKLFASFLGCPVVTVPSQDKIGIDLDAMVDAAEADPSIKLVYVDNPNNPTGTYLNAGDVRRFLSRMPQHVVVVLDGAYEEYATAKNFPDGMRMITEHDRERLVVLRTLSKCHGLASVRFGYGVARPELAACLNTARFPYSINSLALEVAKAAVTDLAHIEHSRDSNALERDWLTAALQKRGFDVAPSEANFILVDFHEPCGNVASALQENGVTVRPVGNYNLPTSQRITVGTREQNRRLIDAIDQVFPSALNQAE